MKYNLKKNEFAGPDGGDGGNGGHVVFRVKEGMKSLNHVRAKYAAENGEQGRSYHRRGKNGQHVVVELPTGSIIRTVNENSNSDNNRSEEENNSNNSETSSIELNAEKISSYVAARGGAGGKGNHYYLSNDNRKPRQFEVGHVGEKKTYHIELKLIADAALVIFNFFFF